VLEMFAEHGFYMDGRHWCVLDQEHMYLNTEIWTACASFTPSDRWSRAHDKDCKYYGTSTGLVEHWCRRPLASLHGRGFGLLLKILITAGEDVNAKCSPEGYPIETIFDNVKATSLVRAYAKDGLVRKFLALTENGAQPLLSGRKKDALSRAVRLRRKCSIHNCTRGLVGTAIPAYTLNFLADMIAILKFFKKNGHWPEAEMVRLKEYWDAVAYD